jgi:GMP synthase-like glutamine amidotransferase
LTNKSRLVLVNNYKDREKGEKALRNLSSCTGESVQMVEHGTQNLAEALGHLEPILAFLSGSEHLLSKPGTKEGFQEEIELVKNPPFPILGICFGHQLIGTAFGVGMSDLGQMVRRFEPVNVVDHHPLFKTLPPVITVAESHRQVLDGVPKGFHLLANSATSSVEAVSHDSLPLYGMQFHPERADETHPHGQMLLRNFVQIASTGLA